MSQWLYSASDTQKTWAAALLYMAKSRVNKWQMATNVVSPAVSKANLMSLDSICRVQLVP